MPEINTSKRLKEEGLRDVDQAGCSVLQQSANESGVEALDLGRRRAAQQPTEFCHQVSRQARLHQHRCHSGAGGTR